MAGDFAEHDGIDREVRGFMGQMAHAPEILEVEVEQFLGNANAQAA